MFRNRLEAGRRLAVALAAYRDARPLVLGLPRGGVPVAAEVARGLGAPLDVVVVRKLAAPSNPEYAFGAVGEGAALVVDRAVMHRLGVGEADLERLLARRRAEIADRVQLFREGRPMPSVEGRTILVVDDGLATGSTAAAAIAVLRDLGAGRIVLAAPVGPPDTVIRMTRVADEVVVLEQPEAFSSVGEHYGNFDQVPDEQVVATLREYRRESGRHEPLLDSEVAIPVTAYLSLPGHCHVPAAATGMVVFAHGSGSSRHSPRNLAVASLLNDAGIGTLLFDLLTDDESLDRHNVFDIELLAGRLASAIAFVRSLDSARGLPIGLFGASTGAAAALVAAADDGDVAAVVSRGGRPDLAGARLAAVTAPTLLIVGGDDHEVLALNRAAQAALRCPASLAIVPGATHLFEEPGTLRAAAEHARDWFASHFAGRAAD